MKMIEPYTLPGFMELLPQKQVAFNKIKTVIEDTYKKYGFLPLDTPIIEGADILLAKAGGETEKQIYRFNKGDSDLCLRFDLTVPLAKYVAKNQGVLTFPFKRYQIGKVYRGERAQRGRFREFYQCDVDVIGDETLSVMYECEIPAIINDIFAGLNLDFNICINNRKILNGLFTSLEISNKADVMRIIDKFDKIGVPGVKKELAEIGVDDKQIDTLIDFISISGTNGEKIQALESLNISNEEFNLGVEELTKVVNSSKAFGLDKNLVIELKIARGLDYYTGTVYETFIKGLESVGSVCSGGRYDNLAGYYTNKQFPGVGISIGLTRLFFVLDENNLLPKTESAIEVMVLPMDESVVDYCLEIAQTLRKEQIRTEVYLNDRKFKNKLNYANKLEVPYVIVIGEDEIKQGKVALKDMFNHSQEMLSVKEIVSKLKK